MVKHEQFKLLDVATVSGSRVSKFSGSKQYVATADINVNQIVGGEKVTYDDRPSRADLVMSRDDVLFAKMKNTVKVLSGSLDVEDKIFSTGFYILTPKENISKKYLYFYLLGADFNRQKDLYSSGATMAAIGNEGLKKIKISLPVDNKGNPYIKEQERIVALLEEAERLKEKRAEANQKMATVIPALFKQMFGELSTNAKGWDKKGLSECVTIGTKLVDPKKDEFSSLPQIGPENIIGGIGELFNVKSAKEKRITSSNYIFTEHHILYSKIRPYLNKVAYPEFSGICSADMYPLLPKSNSMNPYFLLSILRSIDFLTYASGVSQRLRMPKLNREQLASYQVIVPPMHIQNEFAVKVKEILAFEETQKKSMVKINALFSSFLAGALTNK